MRGLWLAATCAFAPVALAVVTGCAPRLENRAGEIITKTYSVGYLKLSDCAFGRLDNPWEHARKVEYPSEKRVNISFSQETANIWQADFTAVHRDFLRSHMVKRIYCMTQRAGTP
jgi:hypothetical protein